MKSELLRRMAIVTVGLASLGLAQRTASAQVLFSDDFDTDTSANWDVFNGSGTGTPDYTVDWAFDYGSVAYTFQDPEGNVQTLTIPPAPNSVGGTTLGVKLTVNNNDDTGDTSGVSLYPSGQSFSGNYALRCDVWMNYNGGPYGGSGSTEFATFGINHSGTTVNWTSGEQITEGDGIWFAMAGEAGAAQDYRAYQFDGVAPVQNPAGLIGADHGEAVFQERFPSGQYESPGAPGKRWVEVEVAQRGTMLVWKINGFVIAERVNDSLFDAGDVMIGMMDVFTSIANPRSENYVIFDNVRVVNLNAEPEPSTVSISFLDDLASEPGSDTATITIERFGGDNTQPLEVPYWLGGTATPGVDYQTNNLTGVTTIPAGQDYVDIEISPINDFVGEPEETILVTLLGNSAYEMRVGPPGVRTTVALLDDGDTTAVNVVASDAYSYERLAEDVAVFEIYRLGDILSDLTVNFTTGGTATAGQDYGALPASVVIPANNTNAFITVTVSDDAAVEGDETVILTVVSGSGYNPGDQTEATVTIQDDDQEAAPVAFQDNFDTDSSANWVPRFSFANGIEDFTAAFAYDYSTDGIPPAPGSGGSTRGLKLLVNKNEATASGAGAVNLYPDGQSFSGGYALRFNMWLTYSSELGGTTEHAIFGVNHSGDLTNRHNVAGTDGWWFAVETDGSGNDDFVSYSSNDSSEVPVATVKTAGEFAPFFTSPPYQASGAPSGQWVDVEVRQVGTTITHSINGNVIFEITNTGATSGNIMLGHMDRFNSIGSVNNFVVYDNVRVVSLQTAPPPIPTVSSLSFVGEDVQIDFAAEGGSASQYSLEKAGVVDGSYELDAAATISELEAGQFRVTAPRGTAAIQFYRIRGD